MMILVTGGSGSGKSAFAEDKVLSFGRQNRIYIATMYPFDEESHERIARHRRMRAEKNFSTVECYTGLKSVKIPKNTCVLLECVSNLTANEMFQPQGAGEHTAEAVLEGIRNLKRQAAHLVVVTNEIFSDGMEYEEETRTYQDYLGRINREAAKEADQVYEVVYGIARCIKKEKKEGQRHEIFMEQF